MALASADQLRRKQSLHGDRLFAQRQVCAPGKRTGLSAPGSPWEARAGLAAP